MNSIFSIRKVALTAHITFSIAWFGAVACFLILAVAGVMSSNSEIVRSSYVSMELIGWYAIVPFCIAALLTGLFQSYISPWGLFRYYWVTVKLVLTLLSTVILFVHMNPISYVASIALENSLNQHDIGNLQRQLVMDAGAALLVLLCIIAISVYKPWGTIKSLGINTTGSRRPHSSLLKPAKPKAFYVTIAMIIIVLLLFVIKHFSSGGMSGH